MNTEITDIDSYIAAQPENRQVTLQQIRGLIKAAVPESVECISYGMPAFRLGKVLVYFATAKHHLGFYPTGSGIAAFTAEFEKLGFKYSKGAVQFPWDRPLPAELIRNIVLHRKAVEAERALLKKGRPAK